MTAAWIMHESGLLVPEGQEPDPPKNDHKTEFYAYATIGVGVSPSNFAYDSYHQLHVFCPTCGSDNIETTTVGVICIDPETHKDTNAAWCHTCKWKGIIHELTDVSIKNEEAASIEMEAAGRAYKAQFGVSEWEAFLTPEQTDRLIELADQGHGTWGKEPKVLAYVKQLRDERKNDAQAQNN